MNLIKRMILKNRRNKNKELKDKDKILLLKYVSRFNFNKYKSDNNFKDCCFSSKSKYFKEFHDKLMDFWILKI